MSVTLANGAHTTRYFSSNAGSPVDASAIFPRNGNERGCTLMIGNSVGSSTPTTETVQVMPRRLVLAAWMYVKPLATTTVWFDAVPRKASPNDVSPTTALSNAPRRGTPYIRRVTSWTSFSRWLPKGLSSSAHGFQPCALAHASSPSTVWRKGCGDFGSDV